MPLPYTTVPRRPILPVSLPPPTPSYTNRSPSLIPLAHFLNRSIRPKKPTTCSSCSKSLTSRTLSTLAYLLRRQPRPRLQPRSSNRRSRSQEPRPAPTFVTNESPPDETPLFVSNPDIRQNYAASSEPVFPSIYPSRRTPRSHQTATAPPPPPPTPDLHQNPTDPRFLYRYYPEEIYVSSVLPTRTPRELRHFQDHCWSIYQQRGSPCSITHGLDENRHITTSPLHFKNLLWRGAISFDRKGITELYYRITTYPRSNFPDLPCLEPAYSVTYPWVGIFWTVNQFDKPTPPPPAV